MTVTSSSYGLRGLCSPSRFMRSSTAFAAVSLRESLSHLRSLPMPKGSPHVVPRSITPSL